jgi:hypothetical protein
MKHNRILLFSGIAFFCAILFISCKETVVSSGIPGDIIGSVQVYDTNYVPMTDNGGVKVSLEGTAYSTLSDASGKWHLTNIPAGTYTLVFSKDGYGIAKQQNFEFTGNGTLLYDLLNYVNGIHTLYPIPNLYPNIVIRPFEDLTQISQRDTIVHGRTDSLVDSNRNYHKTIFDTIITKLEQAIFSSRTQYLYHSQTPYEVIFLSKSQSIDPSVVSSYQYSQSFYNFSDTSGIANVTLRRTTLLQSGFSSGDNIYCIVYSGTLGRSISAWTDPITGKTVYSGFSPHHSEVVSFLLP